jgi:hypothetical protein
MSETDTTDPILITKAILDAGSRAVSDEYSPAEWGDPSEAAKACYLAMECARLREAGRGHPVERA